MIKGVLSFCMALTFSNALCQTCIHTDLSKSLIFKTSIQRIKRGQYISDSCIVHIAVSRKQGYAANYIVTFSTVQLSKRDYTSCNWTRSYSTKKKATNKNPVALYEDYGDLVVGDFNFDGRDDFAAKCQSPNGGTQYNYYVQLKSGRFEFDKFLTKEVGYAPNRLNASTKMLQTFGHAGAGWGETTFIFSSRTGKWKKTKHLFLRSLPANYPTAN
jgi:hypothetical protein